MDDEKFIERSNFSKSKRLGFFRNLQNKLGGKIMKQLIKAVGIALIIIILVSGCGISNAKTITLDKKANASTVELRKGDKLDVMLQGNPSTGYSWAIDSLDSTILEESAKPEFEPDSDLAGAGGEFTFHFEALKSGETNLRLIYHRSWEKDKKPSDTFEIIVVVK